MTLGKVRVIAERIATGMPEEYACILSGVKYQTWRTAKERPEFSTVVKRAAAKFIERMLGTIADGGEVVSIHGSDGPRDRVKAWQGLAWIAERRYPEHFRRQPDIGLQQVTNNNQFGLTEEQWDQWRKAAQQQFIVGPLTAEAKPEGGGRKPEAGGRRV